MSTKYMVLMVVLVLEIEVDVGVRGVKSLGISLESVDTPSGGGGCGELKSIPAGFIDMSANGGKGFSCC